MNLYLCSQEERAAAALLLNAVNTVPWKLTDNFLSAMTENENAHLTIDGPADPTGRGRGYSYTRMFRRVRPIIPYFHPFFHSGAASILWLAISDQDKLSYIGFYVFLRTRLALAQESLTLRISQSAP